MQVADVRKDIDKALGKLKSSRTSRGQRGSVGRELKELRKELCDREKEATSSILRNADVVLSTLTSASPDGPLRLLGQDHFDVVFVDECSQALELACWIALPFAGKAVLAGDHHQLPPTIMSEAAARGGFSYTLMERVIAEVGPRVVRMLKTQYRMNAAIMEWSSKSFYDGQLIAHESVKGHLLSDLPGVEKNEDTGKCFKKN